MTEPEIVGVSVFEIFWLLSVDFLARSEWTLFNTATELTVWDA